MGWGDKGDGGAEFNYDIFVNAIMYPQHNNNLIIK
jgi:hypothetical protein